MSFATNPVHLHKLLERARDGELKLPDFQRSWVWDHERIRELIASVTNGFPIGALMTLEDGGDCEFQARSIDGAPHCADDAQTQELLLDGQQRTTSLFRALMSQEVVNTKTPRGKEVKVWFYFDIRKAVTGPTSDLLDAIVMVPEDKIVPAREGRSQFSLAISKDEVQSLFFPTNRAFDWDDWQDIVYETNWDGMDGRTLFKEFKNRVLNPLKTYQVPVISLASDTSREAVCIVFEKVNTGGKPLDAFELVTAMYAAQHFDLRKDWQTRWSRLKAHNVLARMENTDFLQAVALFHTRDERRKIAAKGLHGRELPPISAKRATLLSVPLESYKAYADRVEEGFVKAAQYLHTLHIFKAIDLPYKTQLVPLAAVLADMPGILANAHPRERLTYWYWRGVFGELYGSATDTRIANDFGQLPQWLSGQGSVPSTVADGRFSPHRLEGMKSRVSAAYKGLSALLMAGGATDWLSGQRYEHAMFFGEAVDIHHIFPVHWCTLNGIDGNRRDSIVNKAPLSARTNRAIGGNAPSAYLKALESPPHNVDASGLEHRIKSHRIEPKLLRSDDFDAFYRARKQALLEMIGHAAGEDIIDGGVAGVFDDSDYPDEEDEQEAA